MTKYQVLAHVKSSDCNLWDEKFESVDEAVRFAMTMTMDADFLIIQVVGWQAIPLTPTDLDNSNNSN